MWAADLPNDGGLIYSGSEAMMSDFIAKFADSVLPDTVKPLYLRPVGILVRNGNPQHIKGFHDLLRPHIKIMVVNGAGQVGLWEDIAGRDGNMKTLATFRANISTFASNSGEAVKKWQDDPSIDAWIIFPIWATSHPGLAEVIPLEPKYRLYRDCGVILTKQGIKDAHATAFINFLASPAGKKIFEKYGWTDSVSLHRKKLN
jgi:accessory colonization factor AcfC